MRPTGRLHLGHYYGVLKNWAQLQYNHDCYFFVADWHALTTDYDATEQIETNVLDMVIDWLAAGVNPGSSTVFVQSQIEEHAELHLLLSMITPLSWLERVPTYKDQQDALREKDLATYGFLGYPLLQSADILMYRATGVPVGDDQVAHVEITREVARRFNHIYGRDARFVDKAEEAIGKLGKKDARLYRELRRKYIEEGDSESLEVGYALLENQQNISIGDRDRLRGYLENVGKIILPEPEALLTKASRMPGLDGQKMSKSYGNAIMLRDDADTIQKKIKTMQTDPARVRRTDPGDPEKCPVWEFHQLFSDDKTRDWVSQGCRSAGIGCVECKQPVIDRVVAELEPLQKKAKVFEDDPDQVRTIIKEGNEKARDVARDTMDEVRKAMNLSYSY